MIWLLSIAAAAAIIFFAIRKGAQVWFLTFIGEDEPDEHELTDWSCAQHAYKVGEDARRPQ